MDTWINAVKAPFIDTATLPQADRPSDKQVAVAWCLIGVLLARAI